MFTPALSSLPWRFLLGLIAGATIAMCYHAYTLRGIELAESQRLYQQQLDEWVAQQNVAAIDAKHTKELSDAQAKIDDLAASVASGRRRLSISAKCVPDSRGSGMDDAERAELSAEASRAYFDLRRLLEVKERQIAGLQDVIRSLKSADHQR